MPKKTPIVDQMPVSDPPGITPEAREQQLVALAINLAEKQLREGTASAQVITHYLKIGSTREKIEKEILEKQAKLVEAKTKAYESSKDVAEMYSKAIDAIRLYSGNGNPDEYDD